MLELRLQQDHVEGLQELKKVKEKLLTNFWAVRAIGIEHFAKKSKHDNPARIQTHDPLMTTRAQCLTTMATTLSGNKTRKV